MIEHCPETRRRIRVAVAAWAYEVHNDPLMSDAEFDALAREIDVDRSTANSHLDQWFALNFNPDTGMWVHDHPEPEGLERIYRMLRGPKLRPFPSPRQLVLILDDPLHIWMVTP